MYKLEKLEKEKKIIPKAIKIFNIVICIIFIPIIIVNATLIIKYIKNPYEIPDFFGYKGFEIVSRSMEKTINKKDIIFIKKVNQNELNVNDIISFNNGQEIITHRIIKIEYQDGKKIYTTKGDNNRYEDKEKVEYEQIEGKYIFKINKLGIFIDILTNRYVLIILFIILLLILIHISKIRKRKKLRHTKIMQK